MTACRLIVEQHPGSGARNMAVDETLLQSAVTGGQASVRIYHWSQPTVSIGYFQNPADIEAHPRLRGLDAVRRLSGGGAILHHHELTYSCGVPAAHPLVAAPARIYACVHAAIIEILHEYGAHARMRGEATAAPRAPFLCFGRGDPHDIVLDPHKIVGSAQRRRRGAVLQHGSLLLRRSELADEYAGVEDLSAFRSDDGFAAELGRRIAGVFSDEIVECGLTAAETGRARQLATEKYQSLVWETRD